MRAFGSLHQPHPTEHGFELSKHLTFGAGDPFAHSRVWNFDQEPPPDQTGTQECLAYWLAATVACDPFNRPMPNPDAIYAAMCRIDGRQHDPDTGSTVQAVVQVAKDKGYLGSVLYTKGAVDLWNFITQHGPAGLALPWFQSMMLTDDDGFLVLPGKLDASQALGGHIILLNGTEVRDEPEFAAVNWFGPMWGFNGRCAIRYTDVCRLLDLEQTIALCPTKTQYTAK